MPSNSPGQADIADLAGVSVSTVSRALADSDLVSSEVKARVRQAAAQVGYPLRVQPQASRLSTIYVFAVLRSFRDTRSSVYHALLAGIRELAATRNIEIEVIMVRQDDNLPDGFMDQCPPGSACIFLGTIPASGVFGALGDANIPAILCNGLDDDLKVDSVAPANHSGGKQIGQHLVENGHLQVGFISGPDRPTLNRRFLGAQLAIEKAGGSVVGEFDLDGDASSDSTTHFKTWFNKAGHNATALFCFNDAAAVWVEEALGDMGISVPDDVSIVGFDDLPIAEIATPALTTFRIDWIDIGRRACIMLEQRMENPNAPTQMLQVGGTLVERASVARRSG